MEKIGYEVLSCNYRTVLYVLYSVCKDSISYGLYLIGEKNLIYETWAKTVNSPDHKYHNVFV